MVSAIATWRGLRIIYSDVALEETDVRLFPTSRHRSARIHKKLVKRFGGEFRKAPCIWQTPSAIVMHPALRHEFEAKVARIAPWTMPSTSAATLTCGYDDPA